MSRDIMIDEISVWDWNSGDAINKPLMSYDIDEETDEFEATTDIPDTFEVEDGVANTIKIPQRNRVLPTRLQDCEVVGDDEVTPDEVLVHFASFADAETINYNEGLKDKKWNQLWSKSYKRSKEILHESYSNLQHALQLSK